MAFEFSLLQRRRKFKNVSRLTLHQSFGDHEVAGGTKALARFLGQEFVQFFFGKVLVLEEFLVGGGLLAKESGTKLGLVRQAVKL